MVVMSGDVGRWCGLFGTLVGVSVLSVMWLELESVSEISSPRHHHRLIFRFPIGLDFPLITLPFQGY